jgi:ribonucleotide monophosphatase NagD (HAD superfamily)
MLRSKGKALTYYESILHTNKPTAGKQLVFVTNNSTKSRADYKKKFEKLGIPAEVVRKQRFQCMAPADKMIGRSFRVVLQRRRIHRSHT